MGLLTITVGASRSARSRALGVGDRDGFFGALALDLEGDDAEDDISFTSRNLEEEELRWDATGLDGDRGYARLFGDTERGRGETGWWNLTGFDADRATPAELDFGGTPPLSVLVLRRICLAMVSDRTRPPAAFDRWPVVAFRTEFRNRFHLLFDCIGFRCSSALPLFLPTVVVDVDVDADVAAEGSLFSSCPVVPTRVGMR